MRPLLFYLIAMAGAHLIGYSRRKKRKHDELTSASPLPAVNENDIIIKGSSMEMAEEDLQKILEKRFPYYQQLDTRLKTLFICKVIDFMKTKVFIIKDQKGFKEMPVLVSAAATQLCFGLKDHTLPFYKYVRIFPTEYFSEQGFKILAGNVQGNVITVAWNHLLDGFADTTDGINLGLHEMSHALYFQKVVVEENYAAGFTKKYRKLVNDCTKAHADESKGIRDIYSDYALQNLQEFWAESVELFFERPASLQANYPEIFLSMKLLLNQNPLHPSAPLSYSNISFEEKVKRIAGSLKKKLVLTTGLNLD